MAMFADTKKKKSKVQIDLGGAFAGFMAGFGAPGGAQMLQAHHQRRQSVMDAANEDQRWKAREDYKRANPDAPQPTQTDRYLQEWLNPGTDPNRKAAIGAILFPPVMGEVNGRLSMIDRTPKPGAGAPPAAAIDELRRDPSAAAEFDEAFGPGSAARYLNGGQTPPASGGFPGFAPIQRSNGSVYNRY